MSNNHTMIRYFSNIGHGMPVDFETAILDGFAKDGGLYVPDKIPQVSKDQLIEWKNLSYQALAFEILSLYIDRSVITADELKQIIKDSYAPFEKEEIIPLIPLQSIDDTFIFELFHGPTLSFKDIGLSFLVNLVNFFLKRKDEHLSIIVATTGDTGPAAAHFTAGKSNLDAWVLYPTGMITKEQERQITTLPHHNVYPVAVSNCPDGGDDLDLVIAKLFANTAFKEQVKLSSVNSINWGRIMMQTVHYFYAYFRVADSIGERVHMSVPSGAFGNLCAGSIARKMGLPVTTFIAANNKNDCLHRIFSKGVFSKQEIYETASSAIDILIPYNFWRFLYFHSGEDPDKIDNWIKEFEHTGNLSFDADTLQEFNNGFLSNSTNDEAVMEIIRQVYQEEAYLLDPHGAVAVIAAQKLREKTGEGKTICFATAHPSKFPDVIKKALDVTQLPEAAKHHSIEAAAEACEKTYSCECSKLETALLKIMQQNWALTKGKQI